MSAPQSNPSPQPSPKGSGRTTRLLKETQTVATSEARIMSEFTNPNIEVLITAEEIQKRIAEIGADIARDYAGKSPLMIGVLKGACTFLSDLMRAADVELGVEFMAISSYGAAMRTSGEVRILKDLDVAIEGRHILVVEDIVDTGLTLNYLLANLKSRGAASVKLAALLAVINEQSIFSAAMVRDGVAGC